MSDVYPTQLLEEQIQLTASEMVRDFGDGAFTEATKQINACNARGDFLTADSWAIVSSRIKKLQGLSCQEGIKWTGHYRSLVPILSERRD